ncbi:unnamed protein product [Ceutorhynchus assimilis]|uniref:Glucose-methanol-choline oxidoreductase N-terminal domain-containing protein n=1 Tax=Ceutorhynchus assimilis TaxID=467358 RepID=A0A9N9MR18_9CUCU|nr:unnamed protein product [Ceutorhynchus assimilis]
MFSEQCSSNLNSYGPSLAQTCNGTSFLVFMTLVDALLRDSCKVSDAQGRIIPKQVPDPEYDFVIIGSGTGGSTVAGRLAEIKQWKILLIEAGDDEPVGTQVPSFATNYLDTSIDWGFKTEPEPVGCQGFEEKRCSWPRGKVLGGTSVINGMMFMRGTPKDYEKWVDAGNTEWSFDQLIPDFKSYEDARDIGLIDLKNRGRGGPVTIQKFRYQPPIAWDILRGGQQIGYNISDDLNGDNINGFAVAEMNNRDGIRLSLAKAFVRPQKNNKNFHVMLNTTASKIIIEEKNGEKYASAVNLIYNNQIFTVNVKKEVIVSAGAVQTPQVLLLSGIGSEEILQPVGIDQVHNLTAVGKGLQNHVSFEMETSIDRSDVNMLNFRTVREYLSNQTGPMSSTGLGQLTARIHSEYSTADNPDIQFYFSGLDDECARTGIPGELNDITNPRKRQNVFINPTYLHTKSKGYIGLHSNNPFDPPKIVANYLTEEQDIKGLRAGIRIVQKLIESPILKEKYGMMLENKTYGTCAEQHQWDSDDYWTCAIKYNTRHENHQGSSCKMGNATNPEACVNQKLQLHGIENIRIMDASVFPTLPSANPQASIIMVAERGARFIKELYLNTVK